MYLSCLYAFTMWTGENFTFLHFSIWGAVFVERNLIKIHNEKVLYMFAFPHINVIIRNQKGREMMCL